MPSKIRILDRNSINQIAAGEVIENSASVIKELVENAVDAGAKKISIECEAGGLQLIRVSDDGEGMGRDDALLSFERHGTSKIRNASDLETVQSMGFRGEALASILAVSKMTLLTSDGESATHIEGAGGAILSCEKGARSQGTTIEVRSLFYNVPARLSFQKSPNRLSAEITKVVTKLALAYPHISFCLKAGSKEIVNVSHMERIEDLLGKEFVEGSKKIVLEEGPLRIKGLLGSLTNRRSNRSGQYFFLNNRAIVSHALALGVEEGYGTQIGAREYPIFVLHLSLDSAFVDVNVHPQKKEVRFKDEYALREALRRAVAKALTVNYPLPKFTPIPALPQEEPEFLFCEKPEPSPTITAPTFFEPTYETLGLFRHFFFVKEGEQLILVDLKNAACRLLESGRGKLVAKEGLLVPLTFEFALHEAEKIASECESLNACGIALRSFGEKSFIVDALSPLIEPESVAEILQGFLSEPTRFKERKLPPLRRKRPFTIYEAKKIFEEIKSRPDLTACIKFLGEKDLENLIRSS